MTRVQRGNHLKHRHKKKLKIAKGFRGASSILFKTANQQLFKAFKNAFVARRLRKRDFRAIWISRVNAKVRHLGLNYHYFVHRNQRTTMNRKIFAQLALYDPSFLTQFLETS